MVVCRQRLPWFNSEIKCAIRTRRKAERKWRRTKSQQDFRAFKGARNRATFVMNGARCEYYTNLIAENSSNQRNLFRITKSLLCEPSEVSFPKDIAPDDLANDFGNFFMQKIDKINQLIDMQSSLEMSKAGEKGCADSDSCAGVTFANFKTLSQEQVSELIKKAAKKSCPLDPMPTSVLLEVLDVLLPVITNMINLSFESGEFASDWKQALLKPLLKKCGLDIAFHNFRPGDRQQLQKVNLNDITVGDTVEEAKSVVRNLGSWFDRNLDMSSHISKQCASAFYHLHNISRIRRFLSTDTTKALVHAFVTSRVDYCNSLLYGLPASHLNKVQRVLNAVARLVCGAPRYCRITPLLYELHWLPVRQRISFKILLFVLRPSMDSRQRI